MAVTLQVGEGFAYATIQAAIDAASAGDTIEIAAGRYDESVVIAKDGLTLTGIGAVEINGTLSEDNAAYDTATLAEWLKETGGYTGGGVGITIGADNVSISGITVKDSLWGIELANGADGTTLTDVVLESNVYGIYKQATSAITELSITGGSISDGFIGINFDMAVGGGSASGVTIDGTQFEHLLRKGVYVETLSDAHLTNITMDDVGQFGGTTFNGSLGAGGNGINVNLKFGDYSGIEIDNFTLNNVGASDRDGLNPTGHQNGGAIVIAARDDGGTYSPNPATLSNVTIHDGTISGTTSTGIHVGEPGKDNADPAVTVTNVTISATTEKSADHGDIANESAATTTVVGTDGNDSLVASGDSDGAFAIDGGGGNDTIVGGSGDDTITGGTGTDSIDGGAGTDTAIYTAILTKANLALVADIDPDTIGDQAGWHVATGGAEGTDMLTGIEVIDHGGAGNILLVGNGGFATIQAAIDAADAGDTILIAAGTYAETLTIDKAGLSLVGLGAVEINGTLSEDNAAYDTATLAEWLKETGGYTGGGVGITIGADNVSISGIAVKDALWGIELANGADGTTLTDVVLESNVYGIYKQATSAITELSITGGSISDGFIGINFDMAVGGGNASGVTIDGTQFEHLLRKGIYVETLSDAHLTNITMDDVGQFGGTTFNGSLGAGGNGINLNLKFGDYSDIEIDNFTLNNVGASDRDGLNPTGHQNGGAIVIAARDDGGTYSPNPATLSNVTIHDGTISGTTSTGIHVGEPGKDNAGPAVTVTNVTISATTEKSGDHGDIANESAATMTIVGTDGNDSLVASGDSDGAFAIDGGAGDDAIVGGSGDDTITGGTGTDSIDGGAGNDTAVYAATLTTAGFTAVADIDPDTIGDQAGWHVATGDAEGADTLTGIEVIDHGGSSNILLVGNGGFATIQAAVDAASAGDTIMIAAGTYAENVTVGKGLTIVGIGEVVIDPATGDAVTIGGDVDGADITLDNLVISGGTEGIYVETGANAGKLTVINSTISGNSDHGIFVLGDDPDDDGSAPITAGITALEVIDTDFAGNGFATGLNGSGHIKLFGFPGSALFQNVTIAGAEVATPLGEQPDNAIEITGYVNNGNANVTPLPGAPDIGAVVFDGVTVTGYFHKNPVALFHFTEIDGLVIGGDEGGLDLSGAISNWGPLLNLDGIEDGVIDASGFEITFPGGASIKTEIQGDKPGQTASDQTITGTAADDRLIGKEGDDTLNGGDGNDELYGHDKPGGSALADEGNDILYGGAGNDALYGGKGDDLLKGGTGVDALDGGDGIDTADFSDSAQAVVVTLDGANPVTATIGGVDDDTLQNVENVIGGSGNDILTGDANANVFTGGGGNDTITGGGGTDTAIYAATLSGASLATVADVDPETGGDQAGWQVTTGGVEGTDTLTGIEVIDHGGSSNTLLVGNGGFATIQAAIDAAGAGDTILIAAGTYNESVTVDKDGLTLVGIGAVEINGTLSEDNAAYDTPTLAEWLKETGGYTGGGVGITIGADNVSISGITVKDALWGIELANGADGTSLTDVVLESNVYGIYKQATSAITELSITGGSISDGFIGINFDMAVGGGTASGVTIDGTQFEHLLRKGIYVETLSDAHLTNITMDDVGQFGGTTFNGSLGAGGNGINVNLKFGDYSDIEIDNFTLNNVGASDRDGLNPTGHQNGGAIVIAARDDGGTYGPNPATLSNVTIHDGTISGTTSTGIHVGEPGKDNADPAVTVTNVTISATTEKSADHGDIANESAATMTIVGTAGNDSLVASGDSDGAFAIDGGGGNDTIVGGSGDDTITGGGGTDAIDGGAGTDTAIYAGTLTTASFTAVADVDPVAIGDQAGWQVTSGGAEGTDTLTGIEVVQHAGGRFLLVGNGGFATINDAAMQATNPGDTIVFAAPPAPEDPIVITVTPTGPIHLVIPYDNPTEITIDSDFDNTIQTGNGDDVIIITGGGDNVIKTGAGNDYVQAGTGNDQIIGGSGNGDDVYDGGGGGNTVIYTSATNAIVVDLTLLDRSTTPASEGGTVGDLLNAALGSGNANTPVGLASGVDIGTDALLNIANIVAGSGGDTLIGNDDANDIDGRAGDDTITGNGGADVLAGGLGVDDVDGGAGNDIVNYVAGGGTDTLLDGGADTDTLAITGRTGVDAAGADTIKVGISGGAIVKLASNGDAHGIANNVSGFESVTLDLATGHSGDDTLDYSITTSGNAVAVDLLAGTATGFTGSILGVDNATGGAGGDTLTGNAAANELIGNAGNDTLSGGEGADVLTGGTGADSIYGGNGNDTIHYAIGDGADTVIDGGADTDTLVVKGTAGNDTVDVVFNGTALTSLEGSSLTAIESVTLDALGGTDTLSYAGTTVAVAVNLGTLTASGFTTVTGVERVTGGDAGDSLTGDGGANRLEGGDGADILDGGVGDDTLVGGTGADSLTGGTGTDTAVYSVVLGAGDATFNGTAWQVNGGADGIDTLSGVERLSHNAPGQFLLVGGGGYANRATAEALMGANDVLVFAATTSAVSDTDGTANVVSEDAGNGTLVGLDASATTGTGGGTVSYTLSDNAGGRFAINAATGVVTVANGALLDFETATSHTVVVRATNSLGAFSEQSFEIAVADVAAAAITGDKGNNTLIGTGEPDTIDGGKGNDKLYGGGGDDLLVGGKGKDRIDGGDGIDTVSYATSSKKVKIDLGHTKQKGGDANGDKLFSIENVVGSNKGDKIVGNNGDNVLDGGGGKDKLYAKGGDDLLIGGSGKDTFYFKKAYDTVTIDDFAKGDTIDIAMKGLKNYKALEGMMAEIGGDVVIDFGKGDVLTIRDTSIDLLGKADFHI